jgi:hypothetical protein
MRVLADPVRAIDFVFSRLGRPTTRVRTGRVGAATKLCDAAITARHEGSLRSETTNADSGAGSSLAEFAYLSPAILETNSFRM